MNWKTADNIDSIDSLANERARGIVFIDATIGELEAISERITGKTVILLDDRLDGVEQITEVLQHYSDLDSIEIIGHGKDGFVSVGNSALNSDNLDRSAASLRSWGEALDSEGDMLFYGCNIATTEKGISLLEDIASLTGADVAASQDLTGSEELGGDWELEVKLGSIETETIEVREYDGVFEFYQGKEYVTTDVLTWRQAQEEAVELGGNLVTINDAAEEAWLRETFGGEENLWIGLNDREVEGQFEWVSGEAVTYTNWAIGQPNDAFGAQDYGSMNYQDENQWNDNFSLNRFRGIVEIPATNPIFTYNGNRYLLTSPNLTWEQAQAEAERQGGNLVTINDSAEEDWLRDTFSETTPFWLGFTDRETEGQFEWVSGETATYTNWAPGEPNNLGGNQDFAVMNFRGVKQWDDLSGGSSRQGIIEIVDPNSSGSFSLEQNTYTVNEIAGNLEITVVRSGGTGGEATIDYRVDSGTALAGEDFTPTSGTLAFASGESSKTFNIPIINDSASEGLENFSLVIETPTGADLGTIRTATVTLIDDESNSLSFNSPNATEGSGSLAVTVTRSDATSSASVDFTTIDGTAVAGSDYQTTSGSIDFAAGETEKTITVPLLDDSVGESNETFSVEFSNPVGLFLSNGNISTATIEDDDAGDFVRETYISGLTQPTAFARTPDNSLMFISEKSGIIKVAQGTNVLATPFIDLSQEVNDVRDRGLLSVAVHPDFFNGSPYIYAAYTYDPPEAFQNQNPNTDLDDPDGKGNRPSRVVRITADAATNFTTAVAGSQEVIVGKNSTWANTSSPDSNSTADITIPESGRNPDGTYIQDYLKTDSESHSIGHLAFGADGALYISVGDGTSYSRVDPRTASVLTPDSLSGKILRVNPLNGEGFADNPFYDGDPNSNRSKVWNSGLRNPFRFTMDGNTPFIGDVGWKTWEEVNVGSRGANFGWGAYEGGVDANGNLVSLRQSEYDAQDIPEIETFYENGNPTAPIFARNHADGARAIIMGDFYSGTSFPSIYQGALFIADVNSGLVDALILDDNDRVVDIRRFDSDLPGIVFMESGFDNNLYYVNIGEGSIGRWRAA